MDATNELCELRLKLVEDLPGMHWYVKACQRCHQEYGWEFAIRHRSAAPGGEPVPGVVAGRCRAVSRRSSAAWVVLDS